MTPHTVPQTVLFPGSVRQAPRRHVQPGAREFRLADDPIHKLLLDRDPLAGAPLASQPTISRFENGAGRAALYRMGRELAACVIERHRRRLHGRPLDEYVEAAELEVLLASRVRAWPWGRGGGGCPSTCHTFRATGAGSGREPWRATLASWRDTRVSTDKSSACGLGNLRTTRPRCDLRG